MKRWPIKLLGEVCTVNPKLAAFDAPGADTEVTFVPMSAVDEVSGTVARPEHRRYSEVAKGYTPFGENDVLFAKITPCMQNGKAAVATTLCNGFGFGSTEFHVLRSTGSVLPRWVFAFIRQPAFRSAAEASFTGSAGQQRVPADFLKTFPIPVPPLAEQERIVKLLDEADELRKLRAQADRRTADLIPALFNEMFGDPVEKTGRWPHASMEDVASKEKYSIVDGPFGASIRQTDYREAGVPIIRIKNIASDGRFNDRDFLYISEDKYSELKRSAVHKGDILISRVGTLGNVCIYPGVYDKALLSTTGVCKITIDEQKVDRLFLHSLILTKSFQRQIKKSASSAVQSYFNLTALRAWQFILPPLSLQKEFAVRVSEIRAMQAEQATSRRRLDDLFQSMLHRAFNGEL